MSLQKVKVKTAVLVVMLLGLSIVCLGLGRYNLSPIEVLKTLIGLEPEKMAHTVVFGMRIPRILLVILSGCGLALSGHVYQVVFRNPLVSPDILGVGSGCSFGAAFAMVFLGGSFYIVGTTAFICGILVVTLTLTLARRSTHKTLSLVLWGIVMSSIASSGLMLMKYSADPTKHLPSIEFWLMGGFYNANYNTVVLVGLCVAVGMIILFSLRWKLKVLMLGDEQAQALGVSVKKVRLLALGMATLIVATIISVVGLVSWIGLIAPHLAKLYTKREDLSCACASMCFGGILLLGADTCARTLFPAELPISILTSFMGAMMLAVILIQSTKASLHN
ncbi:iron ABC transporter permease [Niameybacter massiliensis]|uniref:Iron ABC transporter permease n=1 Tax=Holtiella tumoricola TaxID=3018743 RepID=A0AA42DKT0_9FIRM|nr:iron ABC transporter permease [Holtiella tumoricola]MDA3730661.1 iron ABC transporter permease [Holtiella tumoricola]